MNGIVARPKLVEAIGKPCPYCSRVMTIDVMKLRPTEDHIEARFRREKGTKSRLIVVCSECNHMKGHKTLPEFIQYLERKNVNLARNSNFLERIECNRQRIDNITYLIKSGLA